MESQGSGHYLFFVYRLHELCSVKLSSMGYISTGMGDRFGALLVSLMALRRALVDRNPFLPCYQLESI